MSGTAQTAGSSPYEVIVVAGSMGAITLYAPLFARLSAGFPAAIVVVQHRLPGPDRLTGIIARRSPLPVVALQDDETLAPGTIYVAAPTGQPIFTAPWQVTMTAAPGVRDRVRADPVLASAATHHRAKLLAVVLSGLLDDGAEGVRAVKTAGGQVIAQSPETAKGAAMPKAALATGCVDLVLSPDRIGQAVAVLAGVPGAAPLFRGRPASWSAGGV